MRWIGLLVMSVWATWGLAQVMVDQANINYGDLDAYSNRWVDVTLTNLDVRSFADSGLSYAGFNRSLLGYQFKAGVSVDVNARSNLFLEGVYRGTSGFETNDGFDDWNNASYASWGGQLGVRIGL